MLIFIIRFNIGGSVHRASGFSSSPSTHLTEQPSQPLWHTGQNVAQAIISRRTAREKAAVKARTLKLYVNEISRVVVTQVAKSNR